MEALSVLEPLGLKVVIKEKEKSKNSLLKQARDLKPIKKIILELSLKKLKEILYKVAILREFQVPPTSMLPTFLLIREPQNWAICMWPSKAPKWMDIGLLIKP